MNRTDAIRYKALHRSLYQAQLDLEAQASCPRGHPFSDGCTLENGRVAEIKTNVATTPQGRVICRICNNARVNAWRKRNEGRDAK